MYLEVLNLCIEQCPKGRVLSWNVREGDAIFEGTPIAEYQIVEGKQKRCILCAPYSGYVKQFLVEEGDSFNKETPVLQFVICHHDITMKGMCTTCGQNLIESPQYISHGHPHLSVSKREAQRIDMENAERLLKQQKLSLVLDLDHTLLHAANSSDLRDKKNVIKEKMRKSMKTIEKFTLPPSPTRYYLKLRPGLMKFLKTLDKLYELNIYTMGTRQYATKVAEIIDKKNKFFREHRIISRDDAQDMNFKNLSRLFPCDDSMVVIVDDREDVWSSNGQVSPNLIKIEPFHYFDTIHEINALPRDSNSRMDVVDDIESDDESNSDSEEEEEEEEEMDIHLENVLKILIQIHQEFYLPGDNNRDVKAIIDRMKKQVLQGCVLIFSGLIPLKAEPEKSELWKLAESFGARCVKEFEGSITHVLAAKPGTGKVNRAMKSPNTFLVNVNWLYESCKNWQQANEYDFPIGKLPVFSEPTFSPIPKKRKFDTSVILFDSKEEESNLGDEIDTFDDDEVVSMIEEQLMSELE